MSKLRRHGRLFLGKEKPRGAMRATKNRPVACGACRSKRVCKKKRTDKE